MEKNILEEPRSTLTCTLNTMIKGKYTKFNFVPLSCTNINLKESWLNSDLDHQNHKHNLGQDLGLPSSWQSGEWDKPHGTQGRLFCYYFYEEKCFGTQPAVLVVGNGINLENKEMSNHSPGKSL